MSPTTDLFSANLRAKLYLKKCSATEEFRKIIFRYNFKIAYFSNDCLSYKT